jgi:RHS repeat-associated protein
VTYPDSGTVTVQYNRQGDVILRTDQNATVHAYGFDLLGRPSTDSATTVGSGVDSTVLQIAVTYEIRGMVQNITSYNAATDGTVVNDVQRVYNGFRQLTIEYQEHSGAVNTGTSLKVQYSFADGSANTIRLTSVTYPNGNVVGVSYGTSGSASDLLSRVDSLYWPSGLSSLQVVQYNYLGLATPVQVTYPQPQVQYNLAVAIGDDLYTGLDEFGRVIDLRWTKIASSSSSSSSISSSSSSSSDDDADDLVHLLYGYDQASNRLWRQDVVAGSANLDELYTNDGLYRLIEMQRGQLTGGGSGITDLDFKQAWTLDPTGNWGEFKEYADGSTLSLDQTRTSNTVNEITEFTTGTGTGWSLPEYDAAGNMISMPQPNSLADAYTGIFDAWNRLAKLGTGSGDDFVHVQADKYDGRNFRTTRLTYTSGDLSETRDFYQSLSWQVLEERVSGTPERQYVWGLRYIDDLILRDRSNGGTLNERLYALQDANWNMVAVCDTSGNVNQRFAYSAYGVCSPLNPDFTTYSGTNYDWTVLYTGRELDYGSGLNFYRMRYQHPLLGVFVSRDPIRLPPHSYSYGDDSPLSNVDPSGLLTSIEAMVRACMEKPTPALQIECLKLVVELQGQYQNVTQAMQALNNLENSLKPPVPPTPAPQPQPCPQPTPQPAAPPAAATPAAPPPAVAPPPSLNVDVGAIIKAALQAVELEAAELLEEERKECQKAFPGLPFCSSDFVSGDPVKACGVCNKNSKFTIGPPTAVHRGTEGLASPYHYDCWPPGRRKGNRPGVSIICGRCCEIQADGKPKNVKKCKCAPTRE